MKAEMDDVWDAFVNPQKIEEWGGGPAEMSEGVDREFKLWGGDIHGKNLLIEKKARIEQEWYAGDWKEPSIVKLVFSQEIEGIEVKLIQENIPEDEYKSIDEGWDEYYLGAIKELVEKKIPIN